jgi:hypothetical protein
MRDDDERAQRESFLKSSQPPSFSNTRAVEIHAKHAIASTADGSAADKFCATSKRHATPRSNLQPYIHQVHRRLTPLATIQVSGGNTDPKFSL